MRKSKTPKPGSQQQVVGPIVEEIIVRLQNEIQMKVTRKFVESEETFEDVETQSEMKRRVITEILTAHWPNAELCGSAAKPKGTQ